MTKWTLDTIGGILMLLGVPLFIGGFYSHREDVALLGAALVALPILLFPPLARRLPSGKDTRSAVTKLAFGTRFDPGHLKGSDVLRLLVFASLLGGIGVAIAAALTP